MDKRTCLSRMLNDWRFEIAVVCLILANTMLLGIQVEWCIHNIDQTMPLIFDISGGLFTGIFILELVLRLANEKWFYFSWSNPSLSWNVFDFFIIFICFLCEILTVVWH